MSNRITNLERLTGLLEEGETLIDSINGRVGDYGRTSNWTGVVAITDKRLLTFGTSGMLRKRDESLTISYNDVSGLEWKPQALLHQLVINRTSGKLVVMPSCSRRETQAFVDKLLERLDANPPQGGNDSDKDKRIDAQWNELRPWGANMHTGEWNMLYTLIEPGEDLKCLLGCNFGPDLGQAKPFDTLHDGIGVATNKRVILVDKGLFGSTEVAEIPYRNIEAITYSTGMVFAGVRITGRGTANFRMEMVNKGHVKPFVDCVRSHMDQTSAPQEHTFAVASTAVPSRLDDLERLATLLGRGLITQDEFDSMKRKILSS